MTKFFGFISILIIATLATGCKEGGGATKPTTKPTAKPKEDKTIKVDKSNPIQMYCIRNNTKIRNFNKTYTNWATDLKTERGFTNYAKIGKLSKYENVTMYEIRGNWAYIKTIGDVKGWTPAKYLKKWDVNKFFKGKDNIFSVKSTKELYNDAVLGKVYTKIEKGDTIRVLWGNGKRFFVVSKSGKSGWLSAKSIDSSKLIVKNVDIENISQEKHPVSSIYTNDTSQFFSKDVRFNLDGTSCVGVDGVFNANISNHLLIGKRIKVIREDSGRILALPYEILFRDGKEVTLYDKIDGRYFSDLTSKKSYPPEYETSVKFGDTTYTKVRVGKINFLGMIGIFEVYRRPEFLEFENKYFIELGDAGEGETEYNYYDDYMRVVQSEVVKNNWKNKIKITFYTRDTDVKKIKEVWLEGYFDLYPAVYEYCNKSDKKNNIEKNGKEELKVQIFTIDNFMTEEFYPQKMEKDKVIDIHITKEELRKVGWTADEVLSEWNGYKKSTEIIKSQPQFDEDIFYDKKLIVDGEIFYFRGKPGSTTAKFYSVAWYGYLSKINVNYYVGHYYDKHAKKMGGFVYFINSEKEIIKRVFIKNVLSVEPLYLSESGLILTLIDLEEERHIEYISGVNYEY